jgi:DNA repair protein RadC
LEELVKVKGVGRDKAVTLKAAFELAIRLSEERRESPVLDNPENLAALLRRRILHQGHRAFCRRAAQQLPGSSGWRRSVTDC